MAQRKQYSDQFKAKVVLQALKGQKTINEIASAHGVHPVQLAQWKKQALEEEKSRLRRHFGLGLFLPLDRYGDRENFTRPTSSFRFPDIFPHLLRQNLHLSLPPRPLE